MKLWPSHQDRRGGAEFDVLRGAQQFLRRHRPVVVFEYSGEEISEYGVRNEDFYDHLSGLGLSVATLDGWLRGDVPLDRSQFPLRRQDEAWRWMYVAYDVVRWSGARVKP